MDHGEKVDEDHTTSQDQYENKPGLLILPKSVEDIVPGHHLEKSRRNKNILVKNHRRRPN